MTQKHIMIVTGEASGDLHGSNLVKALKSGGDNFRFTGMGGQALAGEGVEILFDAEKISVMGITEVISRLPDILKAQRILRKQLKVDPPDLLVIIDLPDFNLLLAKAAKKLGIPVYYYICPKIWASRTGRVKKLKERVDQLGVILPFEEEFYHKYGLTAHYVGHPLLDTVALECSLEKFRQKYEIEGKCIGLLPGSRRKEIVTLLPVFLETALKIDQKSEEPLTFLLPRASTISYELLDSAGLEEFRNQINIKVIDVEHYAAMACCDAVVTASGTVTLELALLGIPMVVTYILSPLTYHLARLLVKLEFFSLVNLVGGREIVTELLQKEVTPERIYYAMDGLFQPSDKRRQMLAALSEVREKLGSKGASKRVAEDIILLLQRHEKS